MYKWKHEGVSCKCGAQAEVKRLCRKCYKRENYASKSGRRKGVYTKKKRLNHAGYVVWYDPSSDHSMKGGWVYEHRFVMGELLGRPLTVDESVHHKNGDRTDNRPENLELWSKSQPPGQRVRDKIAWAKELLTLYGENESLYST